jgi:WhiB family redox-sensing transcriptional regulator
VSSRLVLPSGLPDLPDALCRSVDPELFFPEVGVMWMAADAKKVCRRCEVQAVCLQWALDHDEEFGVWGGMTRNQRVAEQKKRAA